MNAKLGLTTTGRPPLTPTIRATVHYCSPEKYDTTPADRWMNCAGAARTTSTTGQRRSGSVGELLENCPGGRVQRAAGPSRKVLHGPGPNSPLQPHDLINSSRGSPP